MQSTISLNPLVYINGNNPIYLFNTTLSVLFSGIIAGFLQHLFVHRNHSSLSHYYVISILITWQFWKSCKCWLHTRKIRVYVILSYINMHMHIQCMQVWTYNIHTTNYMHKYIRNVCTYVKYARIHAYKRVCTHYSYACMHFHTAFIHIRYYTYTYKARYVPWPQVCIRPTHV